MERQAGEDRDYLQAYRRVLASGVLARDRADVLAIDAARWPQGLIHLRHRIEAPGSNGSPEAELALLDFGPGFQFGLAETLEELIGRDAPLAEALLQLQIGCARVGYVFEETAMRLREDRLRFAHAESHGRLLQRLTEAKVLLRARRFDEARAVVAMFRREAGAHASSMDDEAGRGLERAS